MRREWLVCLISRIHVSRIEAKRSIKNMKLECLLDIYSERKSFGCTLRNHLSEDMRQIYVKIGKNNCYTRYVNCCWQNAKIRRSFLLAYSFFCLSWKHKLHLDSELTFP